MSALKSLIEKGDLLLAGPAQPEADGATAAAPPESRQAVADLAKLRASAYIAIGKLGRRLPRLVTPTLIWYCSFFLPLKFCKILYPPSP